MKPKCPRCGSALTLYGLANHLYPSSYKCYSCEMKGRPCFYHGDDARLDQAAARECERDAAADSKAYAAKLREG